MGSSKIPPTCLNCVHSARPASRQKCILGPAESLRRAGQESVGSAGRCSTTLLRRMDLLIIVCLPGFCEDHFCPCFQGNRPKLRRPLLTETLTRDSDKKPFCQDSQMPLRMTLHSAARWLSFLGMVQIFLAWRDSGSWGIKTRNLPVL